MPETTVIHAILQSLEEEHVQYIFGIPGGPLVPLYEALHERKHIQAILSKHEEGAAFMAEGYARVSRGLGVCCTTSGPGATNALTGIASANSDSIPVLHLSAQVSTSSFGKAPLQDGSGGHWNIDILSIFRSATKLALMLHNPQQIPHVMRRILRTALTGRPGAVHFSIPADFIKQKVIVDAVQGHKHRADANPTGSKEAIERVVNLLLEAKCPLFLVGHGINLAGAWKPLQLVAEALKCPVATTLKGKGAFPEDHPLSLGVFGFGGNPVSESALFAEEVDTLIVIGTSLGELQTHGWSPKLAQNRRVVQIDLDPLEIGKNYAVDSSICGDAREILQDLAQRLQLHTVDRSPAASAFYSYLHEELQQEYASYRSEQLQGESRLLKPQTVLAAMSELLPENTLLFVDNGNCLSWFGQYYQMKSVGSAFCSMNIASMGYAIAAAIGGKLAAPDRPVVAIVGDGAFAMNGMEVHTATDYNVPVIWIVLNNGGHGMVYNGEKLLNGESYASTKYDQPLDIATIAYGLGAHTFRVETLDELKVSIQAALELEQPYVIDAVVDMEEIPGALQRRVNTLKSFFNKDKVDVSDNPEKVQIFA